MGAGFVHGRAPGLASKLTATGHLGRLGETSRGAGLRQAGYGGVGGSCLTCKRTDLVGATGPVAQTPASPELRSHLLLQARLGDRCGVRGQRPMPQAPSPCFPALGGFNSPVQNQREGHQAGGTASGRDTRQEGLPGGQVNLQGGLGPVSCAWGCFSCSVRASGRHSSSLRAAAGDSC